MVVDFLKNKNDAMSLITFSTTCFEKRGGPAAPSYPTNFGLHSLQLTLPILPYAYLHLEFKYQGKINAQSIRLSLS